MDTTQKTESINQLIQQALSRQIVLPEFQRDFVWELWQTYDLFDSLIREIFVGSLIYGIPSFELTVREIDCRPRKGGGSRKKLDLYTYSKDEVNKQVKTSGFRLLLDGQQRVTSLCRALQGVDDVWILIKHEAELSPEVKAKSAQDRALEEMLYSVSGKESGERLSVKVADIYRMLNGEVQRERDKAAILQATSYCRALKIEDVEASELFDQYIRVSNKMQDLLKAEKMLSYYMLDTDAEKFSLFFERSNSKGIQLNFIDILAAKLYQGFNLRQKIDEFKDNNPSYELNRESIVRAISLAVSNNTDVDRSFILNNLTHLHFNEHWDKFCSLFKSCLDFLSTNSLLLSQDWMPYDSMIIPLMMFLREIPHNDFSQMDEMQASFVRFWYWNSIFAERYSGSSNTTLVEDTKILVAVAHKEYNVLKGYFPKLSHQLTSVDALQSIYKKSSALYRGILNVVNARSDGLTDWKNSTKLSFNSKLEDHHIFPKDYLKKNVRDVGDKLTECVLNRTLIPKITNIKIGAKKPSVYLQEMAKENEKLINSLGTHLIPQELMEGTFDDVYELFLEERAKLILEAIAAETSLGEKLKSQLFLAS